MCQTSQTQQMPMAPMCVAQLTSFNLAAVSAPVCLSRSHAFAGMNTGSSASILCDPVRATPVSIES